jgi:hypothetical protein
MCVAELNGIRVRCIVHPDPDKRVSRQPHERLPQELGSGMPLPASIQETTMTKTSKPTRSLLGRIAPLAMIILASGSLYAQQPVSISLGGFAEVPAVTTSATGTGEITVQPDRTVSGTIKISGMTATAAHIHEGAAGKNGPPIITLTKAADGNFTVPAGAKLTDAQYASYVAGNLYVNVHSAAHPDGEIRAQLPRTQSGGTAMQPADTGTTPTAPTTRPAY